MAPKKEVVAQPALDTNPFGAFVNVSVLTANVELELPTAPPPPAPGTKPAAAKKGADVPAHDPLAPPQLKVVVHYPGDWAPLTGNPVDHQDGGLYDLQFTSKFRREPTMEAMHELINSEIQISLHECHSNTCLATAFLDVLKFGLGAESINLPEVELMPEAGVPEGYAKVLPGSRLCGVRLWLTHRPKPAAPEGADAQMPPTPTSARPKSPGKGAAAAAHEPEFDESQLEEPQPFAFIPADQVPGSTVIEVDLAGVTKLPPTLPAAVAAATEGKAAGKVTFHAALALPGGASVHLSGGELVAGGSQLASVVAGEDTAEPQVAFRKLKRRQFLTRQQVDALRDHIEDGKPVVLELARYLASEALADAAWDTYHGAGQVTGLGTLLNPGSTNAPDVPTQVAIQAWDPAQPSVLPPYVAPQGKTVKNWEDAPAAGAPKCAWEAAGSSFMWVGLRVITPIVPPWQPPPPPPKPPLQLLPARPGLQPYAPETASADALKEELKAMASALVTMQLTGEVPLSADAEGLQAMRARLEASGRLQELKTVLKKTAVAVALERMRADVDGKQMEGPQRSKALQDLHAQLAAMIAGATDDVVPDQKAEGGGAGAVLATPPPGMKELAVEAEQAGETGRAEALHLRLVLAAMDTHASATAAAAGAADDAAAPAAQQAGIALAEAWYSYAAFCLRTGMEKHGRAEQALRSALEADPHHTPALWALAALLLHLGRTTDRMYYKEALDCTRRAGQSLSEIRESMPGGPPWRAGALGAGLQLLVCHAMGDAAPAEDVGAALEMLNAAESLFVRQKEEPQAQPSELEQGAEGGAGAEGEGGQQGAGEAAGAAEGGEAADGAAAGEPAEPAPPVLILEPGTHPATANGLLGAAQFTASIGLPAVALLALQHAVTDLPNSSGIPEVTLEMDLAAASAYQLMHKWERELLKSLPPPAPPAAAEAEAEVSPDAGAAEGGAGPSISTRPSRSGGGSGVAAAAGHASAEAAAVAAARASQTSSTTAAHSHPTVKDTHAHVSIKEPPKHAEGRGMQSLASVREKDYSRASMAEEGSQPRTSYMGSVLDGMGSSLSLRSRPSVVGEGLHHGGHSHRHGAGAAGHDGPKHPHGAASAAAAEPPLEPFVEGPEAALERASRAMAFALELCTAANAAAPPHDPRPASLMGDVHFTAGRYEDSVYAYMAALRAHVREGTAPPLPLLLNLASAYAKLGHREWALNAYLQACVQRPCASTWLGVAACRLELGDQPGAEAALREAARLDGESPAVWAALTRAALKAERVDEASATLYTALRCGLEDSAVLGQLARGFSGHGRAEEVRACLEAALALPTATFGMRIALAELLMNEGNVTEARSHLEAAAHMAQNAEEMAAVDDLVPRLLDMQLRAL